MVQEHNSVLHIAIKTENIEMVRVLLDNGASMGPADTVGADKAVVAGYSNCYMTSSACGNFLRVL